MCAHTEYKKDPNQAVNNSSCSCTCCSSCCCCCCCWTLQGMLNVVFESKCVTSTGLFKSSAHPAEPLLVYLLLVLDYLELHVWLWGGGCRCSLFVSCGVDCQVFIATCNCKFLVVGDSRLFIGCWLLVVGLLLLIGGSWLVYVHSWTWHVGTGHANLVVVADIRQL